MMYSLSVQLGGERSYSFQSGCHIVRKQVNAVSQWHLNNAESESVINLSATYFLFFVRFYWRMEFSESKHVLIEGVNKLD